MNDMLAIFAILYAAGSVFAPSLRAKIWARLVASAIIAIRFRHAWDATSIIELYVFVYCCCECFLAVVQLSELSGTKVPPGVFIHFLGWKRHPSDCDVVLIHEELVEVADREHKQMLHIVAINGSIAEDYINQAMAYIRGNEGRRLFDEAISRRGHVCVDLKDHGTLAELLPHGFVENDKKAYTAQKIAHLGSFLGTRS